MTRERVTLEVGRELSVRHPNKLLAAREVASGVEGKLLTLDLSRTKVIRPFGAAMLVAMGYECTPQNILEITPPEDATALRQMYALGLDRFFAPDGSKYLYDPAVNESHFIKGVPIQLIVDDDFTYYREILSLITKNIGESKSVRKLLYYAIKESIDNVFLHAKNRSYGLIAAESVRNTKRVRISILDDGPGITETLKRAKKWKDQIQHDLDAIDLATQRNVTGTNEQRGIGLFLLKEFVFDNGGRLSILSGNGLIHYNNRASRKVRLSSHYHGTIIDVEMHARDEYRFKIDDYEEALF